MTAQPVEVADAPWTAREVTGAIFDHFTAQNWAPLVEVSVKPDVTLRDALTDTAKTVGEVWEQTRGRRVDVLLTRRARKPGIGTVERLAVEVKVTRADFLSDIRNPYKQAPARELAHRHAYAVPDGLVTPDEVPADSGLLVIRRLSLGGRHARIVEWARRAPYKTPAPGEVPDWLILSYAYRAAWAEARVKGFTVTAHDDDTDPDALRTLVEQLRGENKRLTGQRDRAAEKADAWRVAYAGAAGLPCGTCGQTVKPTRLRDGQWTRWSHVRRADNAACEQQRMVLAEGNAVAAWQKLCDSTSEWDQRTATRARENNPDRPWHYLVHLPLILPAYDPDDQEPDPDE